MDFINVKDKEIEALIAQVQNTEDNSTRRNAIYNLSKIKNEKSLQFLINTLNTSQDTDIIETILYVLSQDRNEKTLDAIIEFIKKVENKQLKDKAIDYLGDFNEQEFRVSGLDLLINLLEIEKGEPYHILNSIEKIGDKSVVPRLFQIFNKTKNIEKKIFIIESIGKLGDKSIIPQLSKIYQENPDETLLGSYIAEAITIIGGETTIPILKKMLANNFDLTREYAARGLGKSGDKSTLSDLLSTLKKEKKEGVILALIEAIGKIGSEDGVDCLKERYKESTLAVKECIINALSGIDHENAFQVLVNIVLEEDIDQLRNLAASHLEKYNQLDWKQKIDYILKTIQQKNLNRSDIDSKAITKTFTPSSEESTKNEHLLIDTLIGYAPKQDNRFSAILASLIIESAGGSTALAGDRVNKYALDKNIPNKDVENLRIEIGGQTALEPLFNQVLKPYIELYFSKPINELNDLTFDSWRTITKSASEGFKTRKDMCVGIYWLGIVLVIVSGIAFFLGRLSSEQMWGVGVSFISGISAVFVITYRGPLKDIQESVEDLGIASAAFIGYVHRVLEISLTFSYSYLIEKMTFEEMKKSSDLIEDAMMDINQLLSQKRNLKNVDVLTEMNENLKKIEANTKNTEK